MYLVPFDLKRAYLNSLSFLQRATRPHGLTPARFELLYLMRDGAMLQCAIHRALGVTRVTTCRMLISLDELGLVSRKHPPGKQGRVNQRDYLVQLTAEGRKRLRAVTANALGSQPEPNFPLSNQGQRALRRRTNDTNSPGFSTARAIA